MSLKNALFFGNLKEQYLASSKPLKNFEVTNCFNSFATSTMHFRNGYSTIYLLALPLHRKCLAVNLMALSSSFDSTNWIIAVTFTADPFASFVITEYFPRMFFYSLIYHVFSLTPHYYCSRMLRILPFYPWLGQVKLYWVWTLLPSTPS